MSDSPPKKVKASLKADFTIPPSAMYGKLSQLAYTLDTYAGWSYCALLAAWAGRHSTKINRGHKLRPQLYLALVGGPNGGKSVSLDRAIDTINPGRIGVIDTIPGSDKALYQMFPYPEECNGDSEPPSVLLALDEMQIMMQKMAIGNSSLSQTLCTLFYKDTASTAAKSGMERLLVRLTICGALKAEDATDFRQSFGNATNDGLYDRFLICPPPLKEKPVDNTWRARRASLEFGAGRVNDARTRQALEWQASAENEKARRARGRLQELALRVASVSASANDEDDISDECMQAAFRFCEWQERIRNGGYSPSQSLNIQAQLSESIIEAFVNLSAGRQIWVRWRDVHHNKNWRNRYGSVELNRSFAAALQLGEIEAEMKDGEKTGRYQLAEHFFPAPLEVVAEAPVERHPNG